jgi:hypothetical protein
MASGDGGLVHSVPEGSFGGREGWRCAVWSRPFGSAFSPLDGRLRAHAVLRRFPGVSVETFSFLSDPLWPVNSSAISELSTIRTVNRHPVPRCESWRRFRTMTDLDPPTDSTEIEVDADASVRSIPN